MASLTRAVRLCAWLLVAQSMPAQLVTDTKEVRYKDREELLRKINGRWFSQDNREVNPPSSGWGFWLLDSEEGTCQFFHHRPFQLTRAEWLHLWMKPAEVEALIGTPNRTLGRDNHAMWFYYAANGTKLTVRFMGDSGLGEAKYDTIGGKTWPVASIEQELAGRSIYALLAERASNRTGGQNRFVRSKQPGAVTVEPVSAPVSPPKEKRIVSATAFEAVAPGMTREEVLSQLGEPSSRFSIAGDDGVRETLTYDLDTGEAAIRLVAGKVVKVR
jgi:hypothetical protein